MPKKNPKLVSAKRIQSEFNFLKMLAALGIAVLIIVVVVFLIADDPMKALGYFFLSPFDSVRHVGNIIENATPVLFTGIATCMLFAAGDVTLAGEGSVFLGGFLAAAVAVTLSVESKLLAVIAILVASIGGGLLSLIPVIAKKKFRCDSFVFSLLLNYVVLYIGVYVLNYFLHDYTYIAGVATSTFPAGAVLDPIIPKTSVNIGFILGLVLAVVAWFFMNRTRWGYDAQLIRSNESFAKYTGVNITKISLLVAFLGGCIAAMGGAVEILGKYPRYSWVTLPGYGWDGFMVATLAYYNPIFVPLAALFLGYIRTGAQILNLKTNIPLELISAIQAIMILMIASKALMNKRQQKRIEEQTRLRRQLETEGKEGQA
ncbi:MAG: ABC transporter permease [Clostridiales bacterium]|nr:ABC transporter permease [Clostridiales bacterium]